MGGTSKYTPLWVLLLGVAMRLGSARADTQIEFGSSAAADPSPWALVGAGLLMGAADYFAGVAAHEGSHALTVEMLGGQVLDFSVLPRRMPDGHLFFGYTTWASGLSAHETALVLIAPKILDTALLATYTTLLETENLPDNKYAQLVLLVAATGAWVDFSKDLFTDYPGNDLVRFYGLMGLYTAGEKLPVQIGLAALSLVSGIEVARGYVKLFSSTEPKALEQSRSGQFVFSPNYLGYAGRF